MDPQLKQRLVGAAVLVSVAVLVVPILLDGGYQQVNAPRRDMAPMPPDSFEEVVPPLSGGIQTELESGLTAEADELSATAAEAAAQVAADPALSSAPAPAGPEVAPEEADPVATAVSPIASAPVPAAAPAPVAKAPPEPAPPPATPAGEQWTVQLGSFASRANAEGLLERVKASGVPGFILPLTEAGKTSFRVRAGPVGGRAAADRLRGDLERTQAIRGMLVRHP